MSATYTYTLCMKLVALVIVALVLIALLPETRHSSIPAFTASVPAAEPAKPVQVPVEESDPTDMLPWRSERLPVAISLSDCSGVKIIEWRGSKGYERSSTPSETSVNALNQICARARANFFKFIHSKGYVALSLDGFHQDVCLMPADIHRDGRLARNLNDVTFRFKNRDDKEFTPNGQLYSIWGYTNYNKDTMFMWSMVLNENSSVNQKFATIFSHELFHAMSHYSKLYLNYRGSSAEQDEKMAQEFTQYLGLPK